MQPSSKVVIIHRYWSCCRGFIGAIVGISYVAYVTIATIMKKKRKKKILEQEKWQKYDHTICKAKA